MLNENQVRRLLKHCELQEEKYEKAEMCGDEGPEYFDFMQNKGWCQALRLVLEEDTYPIRKDPIKEKK